jgi:hypothetical protein
VSDPAAEFDGPWKEALDLYFRPFVEFLFPPVGREIDWERPVEFHDKELQKIAPGAEAGTGAVDKLAKVWTRQQTEEFVFIHVEVQSQYDSNLARRMYQYNHRIEDRYGSMPVSLAVLGDYGRAWRPTEFTAGRWGCEVKFTFPAAKVADWRGREEELEREANPFAGFVLAHLKTVETDDAPADRLSWKLRIVKRLYDRGMSGPEIVQMFRIIDWMMTLPPGLAAKFETNLDAFEKERQMPFITPTEQRWMNKGQAKGHIDGIEVVLELRFGAEGLALMPRVRQIADPAVLEQLLRASKSAADLDAFRQMLPPEPQA